MLLLGLCWYFQPSLYPLFAFLLFELIIKSLIVMSQNSKILDTERVPDQLQNKFNRTTFEKSRRYCQEKCRLELTLVFTEQVWKSIKISIGCILFDFTFTKLFSGVKPMNDILYLHWPTIELFCVTATFTLVEQIFNLHKRALTFIVDNHHGVNTPYSEGLALNFLLILGYSVVKNALLVSIFIEITATIFDVTGLPFIALYFGYWFTFTGFKCLLEWSMGNRILSHDKLIPISEAGGALPKFIKLVAKSVDFCEDNILVSDNSWRTTKQKIYLRGLVSPKIIIDRNLLMKYENVFNPPIVTVEPTTEIVENAVNENDNQNLNEVENEREMNDGSEMLSLITRQLARWKFNDAWALENFDFGFSFLRCLLLAYLVHPDTLDILANFCAVEEYHVSGFFLSLLMLLDWTQDYAKNEIKRRQELSADRFVVKAGYADDLKTALIAMYENNLEFPLMHKIYETNCPRNSLLSRLESIDEEAAKTPLCTDNDPLSKIFIFAVKN